MLTITPDIATLGTDTVREAAMIDSITRSFSGMTVEVSYHDENPSEIPDTPCYFYNGYWEVICTVTKDNLSVCEKRNCFLLVRPVIRDIGILGTSAEYTYMGIDMHESLESITYGPKIIQTDKGELDVDIVLLTLVTGNGSTRLIPVLFEHNKEAWLESLQSGGIFNNNAAP
jgi:hypothetical protein